MAGLAQGIDLNALKQKIDAAIPKEYRRGYNQTMAAGMKLMFSDQTFPEMKQYMDSIQSPDQIPEMVAHGIVKAMSILMNESKGRLQIESSAAAAQGLMTQALQYLQQVKGVPITSDIVAKTTQAVTQGMLHLVQQYSGLSQDQFQRILQGQAKEVITESRQSPPQPDQSQAGADATQSQPGAMAPPVQAGA